MPVIAGFVTFNTDEHDSLVYSSILAVLPEVKQSMCCIVLQVSEDTQRRCTSGVKPSQTEGVPPQVVVFSDGTTWNLIDWKSSSRTCIGTGRI